MVSRNKNASDDDDSGSATDTNSAGGTTSSTPPASSGEFELYVLNLLDPYYDEDVLGDPTSPQSLALDWMLSLELCPLSCGRYRISKS